MSGDILRGVAAITNHLYGYIENENARMSRERQTNRDLALGRIPGKKLGIQWISFKSQLNAQTIGENYVPPIDEAG